MKQNIILLLTSCFFFVCFFVFSVAVKKGMLATFDFDTTVRFQDHTPAKFNKIFPIFGFIASVPVATLLLSFMLIAHKKIRGLLVLFLFFAAHSVEVFGKLYIHHPPPPFLFYKHVDAVQFALGKYYTAVGSSYPSGHEFRSVFLSVLAVFLIAQNQRLPRLFKYLLYFSLLVFVILVGVSRVSLGEHWTSDIIGGTLFGLATSLVCPILLN